MGDQPASAGLGSSSFPFLIKKTARVIYLKMRLSLLSKYRARYRNPNAMPKNMKKFPNKTAEL